MQRVSDHYYSEFQITYNIMASIIKIFVLITAIISISGEVLDLSKDTDQPGAQVSDHDETSDTLDLENWVLPSNPDEISWHSKLLEKLHSSIETTEHCDGIDGYFGCITTEKYIEDKNHLREIYEQMRPKDNKMSISSRLGSKRERRSMIRNRKPRSATTQETSSSKNSTEEVHPAIIRNRPPKLSYNQRLLIMLWASLTSPYLAMVPNPDYDNDQSGPLYTS